MLQNIFSLKTNLNFLYFIKNEIKLLDSIDPNIIKEFKKIIIKINKKNVNFHIFKKGMNKKYLLSFVDNRTKNFYPFDYHNQWSNYNFFKNYLKFSNYEFNSKAFQKINYYLKRFSNWKVKKIYSFLPIYIKKPNKNSKELINKYFPKFFFKDDAFTKKKNFLGFHGYYYEKTNYINYGAKKVASLLNDTNSKYNYKMMLNGNAHQNWKNYFNKAHLNYQYSDYIKLNKNSVILNCGVESGIEIKLFNNVKKIYNIDPGKNKYLDKTVKYILKKTQTKNYFLSYALYTQKGIYTKFEKNLTHKVVTLKDIIQKYSIDKIDLIKSDIEGAERYMIDDLIEICNKFNCQLAISIYHTNHDLKEDEKLFDNVDLPLRLMNKLKNKYNFYFNIYTYERWEGIFYCIPKVKSKS
jgi:FkbM family methyltransferase